MDTRSVIVTGAYGSIGFAIAKIIAGLEGYRVCLVGRDEIRLIDACNRIVEITHNNNVSYRAVDLSIEAEIQNFAQSWEGPLHVLINNAASCPRKRTENMEGIEMQFATNVLGYHRLIRAFESRLKASAPARVVNVASYWAGNFDINDLEFKSRRYDNDTAYRQSKQADRMISRAFAEEYSDSEISVNACHPGDVNSKLSNSLGYGGHESPEQGAATPVWVATSSDLQGISGRYFEHHAQQLCRFSQDLDSCMNLLRICDNY